MTYRIDVKQKFDPELERVWQDLEKQAECYVFQCYGWLSHWHKTIGWPVYRTQPFIVLIFYHNELLSVLPLGLRKRCGITILEWLGGGESDYHGPLSADNWRPPQSEFLNLWDQLLRRLPKFDVIYLRKQPECAGLVHSPFLELPGSRLETRSLHANLPSTWKEFKSLYLDKRMVSDSLRQRRRLSEKGEVKFLVGGDLNSNVQIIEGMIQQKRRRYREIGAPDLLESKASQEFYKNIFDLDIKDGSVHISALMLDEKLLASHWGIVYRDRFYYLMPSFEGDEWSRYSTGRLLLEHLVEWAISKGLSVFDFTIGNEEYKQRWCNSSMNLYTTIQANTFIGQFYVLFLKIKDCARKVRSKIKNISEFK